MKKILQIWMEELLSILHDEGVLIFFVLVPLGYPLLYSWIYNNEVVKEVPVAVVDESHTSQSRQFVRRCNASPDICVTSLCSDMQQARRMMEQGRVKGIYHIPADFSLRLSRQEQTTVSVYCDMSLMLYYKAVFQTANSVALSMGAGGGTPAAEEVSIFNPAGGYGSFILPAVLILILQQTLVLGIGLSAGTARERNNYGNLLSLTSRRRNIIPTVLGKALCYLMVYALMATWLTVVVPRIFHFVTLAGWRELTAILVPYTLASIFFAMTISCLVRYRENVMLLVVFFSVPLLFISGVSWPSSAISWFWTSISTLFPSTFAIQAFVRSNSMGAVLTDISREYTALWVQVAVYFLLACTVYRYQWTTARKTALQRISDIRRKRAIRQRIRQRQSGQQK